MNWVGPGLLDLLAGYARVVIVIFVMLCVHRLCKYNFKGIKNLYNEIF